MSYPDRAPDPDPPRPLDPDAVHLAAVSLDCAEPEILGAFYRRLLGGEVLWRTAGSVGVRHAGLVLVAQRVPGYVPPTWPDASVVHLDLDAGPDPAASADRAVRLGATRSPVRPDPRWEVLLDPAGHPFCLTTVTPDAVTRPLLSFGCPGDRGLGDRLLAAAVAGTKTATSSLAVEYLDGEPLPRVGELLTLADHDGRAHATARTTRVQIECGDPGWDLRDAEPVVVHWFELLPPD